MRRASRGRPPKLDAPVRATEPPAVPTPSPGEFLVRSGVAGRARGLGTTELRRLVERIVAGDPAVLAGLEPFAGAGADEVGAAVSAVFGAVAGRPPEIDPSCTLAGVEAAADAIATAVQGGGRIVFATGYPASLLPLYQRLAVLAASAGGDVVDDPDSPTFRAGGRVGRFFRWFDGVAAVTDGASVHGAEPDAADELLFTIRRPRLLVTDASFAGRAVSVGIPTVAFAGLTHAALAVAARRGEPLTVVPVVTDREPAAYTPLAATVAARLGGSADRRLESA